MILPPMIDREILTYSKWKKALEQEDIKEVGNIVKRSENMLYDLYQSYIKFQSSVDVCNVRRNAK